MKQLVFNKEFNSIVEEKEMSYWKTMDEVPEKIQNFLQDISFSRLIYSNNQKKYYCPNCFTEVRYNLKTCPKCQHSLIDQGIYSRMEIDDINENSGDKYFYYFAFDIQDENVYLYKFREETYVHKFFTPRKISHFDIDKVFLIKKTYLIDLTNDKEYFYEDFNKENALLEENDEDCNYETFDFFSLYDGYLYLDNLDELKETIYQYTLIWQTKKYLRKHKVSLADITYLPLFNRNFEYLVKYQLFNLAFMADKFKYFGTFKKTFGLEKRFLPFMIKYDLSYRELSILQLTKKEDIKLIRRLESYEYWLKEIINDFKIDIFKLINYFDSNKIKYDYLIEYYDYLFYLKELGINWHDKKYLYPRDILKEHDKYYQQYEIIKDQNLDERIKKIAKLLQINKYEDDNYCIYPAPDLNSLILESRNQNNCVRAYAKRYSEGECIIYLMREKKNIDKSLVTIEVVDDKIVQAREKNNKLVREKYLTVIRDFEKNLR